MAKDIVRLPSGYRITQSFLERVILEAGGDTLDFMALKELEPQDLKYIFSVWLDRQLES